MESLPNLNPTSSRFGYAQAARAPRQIQLALFISNHRVEVAVWPGAAARGVEDVSAGGQAGFLSCSCSLSSFDSFRHGDAK
jgi:hypothetical protein